MALLKQFPIDIMVTPGAIIGGALKGVSDMAFPIKTNGTLVFFYYLKQNEIIFYHYISINLCNMVQINDLCKKKSKKLTLKSLISIFAYA